MYYKSSLLLYNQNYSLFITFKNKEWLENHSSHINLIENCGDWEGVKIFIGHGIESSLKCEIDTKQD